MGGGRRKRRKGGERELIVYIELQEIEGGAMYMYPGRVEGSEGEGRRSSGRRESDK